jgi:hypothetical protein
VWHETYLHELTEEVISTLCHLLALGIHGFPGKERCAGVGNDATVIVLKGFSSGRWIDKNLAIER